MKNITQILFTVMVALCLLPVYSWAKAVGGADLLLSIDPAMFDKGGSGYVKGVADPWLKNSYVTSASSFELFVFSDEKAKVKKNNSSNDIATDINLLVTVHAGETGQVTVGGISYTAFSNTTLPAEYGGGSHGIYAPDDGYFMIAPLGFDLGAQQWQSVEIQWDGFTEVHFDAFSLNGFYNSPKNDVTGVVPVPSSIVLFGAGLVCLVGLGRRKRQKN